MLAGLFQRGSFGLQGVGDPDPQSLKPKHAMKYVGFLFGMLKSDTEVLGLPTQRLPTKFRLRFLTFRL